MITVVVEILRRDIREIVVTVPMAMHDKNLFLNANSEASSTTVLEKECFLLVAPTDMKLPKVRLRTRQKSKLGGNRVIVAFDNWPVDSMFPNFHFVRIIGEANDWKTEVEDILIRHSIFPRPFSAEALAFVPIIKYEPGVSTVNLNNGVLGKEIEIESSVWRDSKWVMPTDNLKDLLSDVILCQRRDLRKVRRVFSVDPPGCQDIDDAMSVYWVRGGEGIIEIAVSIADVCAFLPQGCSLDLEAQTRGTTVYLTHKRMDMLPALISGDIASLHGDKDRYAVTVTWHVKLTRCDGRPVCATDDPIKLFDSKDILFSTPVLHSCGRTAIRSVAAMTYSQAHNLFQGNAPDLKPSTVPPGQAGQNIERHLWDGLRSDLKVLTVFGRFLKSRREQNGALDLTQTGGELKFKLNAEGEPLDVNCKEEMEVHSTIAELMIIANSTVARIIDKYRPHETLMRIHAPPVQSKQEEIMKLVKQTGLGIFDNNASEELRDQLRTFREKMLFPKSKKDKSLKKGPLPLGQGLGQGLVQGQGDIVSQEDIKKAESIVDFVTSSVIKSMCEATYVCAGTLSGNLFSSDEKQDSVGSSRLAGHYGLGLSYYTHFTSPIRRYADIIVHRQLLSVLEQLGQGCGLREIQLSSAPSSSAPSSSTTISVLEVDDCNICYDYEDKKNKKILLDKKNKDIDFISSQENAESYSKRSEILGAVVPESKIDSLEDIVLKEASKNRIQYDESVAERNALQGIKKLKVADGRINFEKVCLVQDA